MGRSGPRPLPTVIQLAKGDPGKRAKKAMRTEPIPPPLKSCPRYLKGPAHTEWNRVMRFLREMGERGQRYITEADRAVLAAYCQAVADHAEAVRMIRKEGSIVKIYDRSGLLKSVKNSPWVLQKERAAVLMKQNAAELGFTPSGRTRVRVEEKAGNVKQNKAAKIIGF